MMRDTHAQMDVLLLLLPFVVALGFVIFGLLQIQDGCAGFGVVLIGVGFAIGGIGGSLRIGWGALVVGGGGGVVLIVVGVLIRIFITHC